MRHPHAEADLPDSFSLSSTPTLLKEKFGGLRFYVNCRRNEAIRQRIGIAADESFHTCEICGQTGELREDGWIKTLCDLHDGAQG